MSLELSFLGTGTSAGIPMIGCPCRVCGSDDPRDRRTRPSVMVRYPSSAGDQRGRAGIDAGEGAAGPSPSPPPPWQFLIDTTPELRTQAIRHGLDRIDGVFLTHAHADHVMGLDDLRRFNATMRAPVDLYGEAQTLDRVKHMFSYIFDPKGNINGTFIAQLVPREVSASDAMVFGAARWTPLRLFHGNLPIVGYRIDLPGADGGSRSVAYCTDVSRVPDETHELLSGLDVLVLDALRYKPHPTHLTVEQALQTIERIRPGRSYLTHIAHDIRHAELEGELPSDVELAYDGLVVSCG